jgi:antitoxin HicB
MKYAVRLSKDDNGTFLVRVPDVPEAITYGETREEALARAVDAILTVFDDCIRTRRPIPAAKTTGPATVEIQTSLRP